MSDQYGVKDAACPISTKEGGGGGAPLQREHAPVPHTHDGVPARSRDEPGAPVRRVRLVGGFRTDAAQVAGSPGRRRVRLVREEGRDVSS